MRAPTSLVCALLFAVPAAAGAANPAQGPQGRPAPAPVATAESAGQRPAEALPVRRVVLYKNGVGYFEHLGQVRGNQDVTIDFTSGQLNDVLKSLTTLDLGGGRITSVTYDSEAPIDQQLAALGLPLGEVKTVAQFFAAIRGARMDVRTPGGAVSGRLLAVEQRTRDREHGGPATVDQLSIVTDSGEVRLVELSPSVVVRIADRNLERQMGRYLGIVASALQQSVRRMTVSTTGTGERPLLVSYVSEVPVWKTTYRLVLPAKAGAKPFLQGWAIVDNTVGEDWSQVEMSLVAGAPQSFVQQISQPYYIRRPVVELPGNVQLTPQTHEAGLAPVEAPAQAETTREEGAEDRIPRTAAVGGAVRGVPSAPAPPPPMKALRNAEEAMLAQAVAASGHEMGDLFEYRIGQPVSIRKNGSAMVPIVNGEVGIEKVTIWNPSGKDAVPLRGVWLDNTTGLTLDGGSFTVLESEAFAGEGLVSSMKPGEKRLLSYAADTSVHVAARTDGSPRRVERIRVSRGTLVQVVQDEDRRTYTIRNEDAAPRTVIVEHPLRAGWKLKTGSPQPVESTASVQRFRVVVQPKATSTLAIDEVCPREVRYQLSQATPDDVALLLRGPGVDPAVEAALRPLLEKKRARAAVENELQARRGEVDRIDADQSRIRENMKALRGSAEEKALLQRYVRQLDEQENRLDALRRQIAETEQKRDSLQGEIEKMIEGMTVDVTV